MSGTGTMTNLILDLAAQFSKGFVVAVRTEDRIIAKALYPTPLACNLAFHNTLEQVFLRDTGAATGTYVLLLNKGNDSAKTRLAVVLVVEFAQQTCHIGFAVVTGSIALHTGIAGAVDAWCAVQCLHLETSIVGKAVQMIMVVHVACLLQGVLLESLACLRDIHITADILQRQHLYPIAQNLAYFLQLVLVVGGEYYFHF